MSVSAELAQASGLSLRAGLGLLFALVFPRIPLDSPGLAAAFALGWVLVVVARVLVLREPEALRRLAGRRPSLALFVGEALFVTLALVLLLLWLAGSGLVVVPLGPAVVMGIAYLLFHAVVLYYLTGYLAVRVDPQAPARPRLRALIRGASLFAEECVLLAGLAVTEGARLGAVAGPWTLVDLLSAPLLGIALLVLCYRPIAEISAAVSERPLPIVEILVVQAAALYVLALTGSLPF